MFSLKVLFWGVVVFGGVLLIPKLLGGSTSTSTAAVLAEVTTTAPTTTALITTVPTTTAPTTTAAVLATTTIAVRDPSEVQVQVVNSTDRNGLAASLSEALATRGYEMADSDNYSQTLDTTHVWYSSGFDREAAVLASGFVPGAIVEEAPEPLDVDILVVIGASYKG
ncbi:MAG: LytR C-terminal domain-containing protein [Actinobacteria bacterium]|nr:LytR C-terminal domain-containing protein [Actinomycetota bacterium]